MKYRLKIRPRALKSLQNIPRADQARITRSIDSLANEPRPDGVKKLKGATDLYRIRTGDYRVIYQIKDDILLVLVVRVAHRREVYRGEK
jgi:mRNA interferase RelE/StbE